MGRNLEVLAATSFMGNIPTSGLCAFASATTQSHSRFFEFARHSHALSLKDVQLLFSSVWNEVTAERSSAVLQRTQTYSRKTLPRISRGTCLDTKRHWDLFFFFYESMHKTPVEITIQFKCCARDEPRCLFSEAPRHSGHSYSFSAHSRLCWASSRVQWYLVRNTCPLTDWRAVQKIHGICFSETIPKWVPGIDL